MWKFEFWPDRPIFGRNWPGIYIFGFFGPGRPILHPQMPPKLILSPFSSTMKFCRFWKFSKKSQYCQKFLNKIFAENSEFWSCAKTFQMPSRLGMFESSEKVGMLMRSLWCLLELRGKKSPNGQFLKRFFGFFGQKWKFLARGARAMKNFFCQKLEDTISFQTHTSTASELKNSLLWLIRGFFFILRTKPFLRLIFSLKLRANLRILDFLR